MGISTSDGGDIFYKLARRMEILDSLNERVQQPAHDGLETIRLIAIGFSDEASSAV